MLDLLQLRSDMFCLDTLPGHPSCNSKEVQQYSRHRTCFGYSVDGSHTIHPARSTASEDAQAKAIHRQKYLSPDSNLASKFGRTC